MRTDGKFTTYLATGMVTIGFGLMFFAWNGAANLDYVQGQVPFLLSGTLPGLGLVLTGLTLALVQEIRRTAGRLLGRLDQVGAATPAAEGPASWPAAVPDDDYVVATAATFHQPDCRVVDGRTDLTPMSVETARDHDLAPCRICDPEEAIA